MIPMKCPLLAFQSAAVIPHSFANWAHVVTNSVSLTRMLICAFVMISLFVCLLIQIYNKMLNTQYHAIKYFTLNEINDSLNDSTDFPVHLFDITDERTFHPRLADLRDRHCRRVDF